MSQVRKPYTELEVRLYDWPSRFMVEATTPNRDDGQLYDYLVDLEELDNGMCNCEDFIFNVQPYLNDSSHHRTFCVHILAARRYKILMGNQQPKPMPATICFQNSNKS